MKKSTAGLLCVVGVALAGYVIAGPFITIHHIKSAVARHDSEALASEVDFPALRANLKDQLDALMTKQLTSDLKDNPLGALGAVLASKIVDSAVEAMVTPRGIANLMSGKPPPQGNGQPTGTAEPFKNARYTYDSASKFSAWVSNDRDETVRFVFTRYDLSWKLSNILLPLEQFGNPTSTTTNRPNEGRQDSTKRASKNDEISNCLKIETFDSSVLSKNDIFTELAWKIDVSNVCTRDFSVRVKFAIYDKDEFELDSANEEVDVPANGTGKARGKMLVSPPSKADRMAKQGASLAIR